MEPSTTTTIVISKTNMTFTSKNIELNVSVDIENAKIRNRFNTSHMMSSCDIVTKSESEGNLCTI